MRHTGLLLAPKQVKEVEAAFDVPPLSGRALDGLRRDIARFHAEDLTPGAFVDAVFDRVCGFTGVPSLGTGGWQRGSEVPAEFGRTLISGESLKPRHLWTGRNQGILPVFFDKSSTLGLGRSRKTISDVVQWLRLARQPLAVLTNARQWRLIYAGLDFDASCESDLDLWLEEGTEGLQLLALRHLLQPRLWTPAAPGDVNPLAAAVRASRKGQGELSAILGERVREAVEALVQAHGEALLKAGLENHGADIYRAAVRVVMRMVVVLFAESRDLLPRSSPLYYENYSLQGLFDQLQRLRSRGRGRLASRYAAWPRVLALFRLIHDGSYHEALGIRDYGGELFRPAETAIKGAALNNPAGAEPAPAPGLASTSANTAPPAAEPAAVALLSGGIPPNPLDPMAAALRVFETACFDSRVSPVTDETVQRMLEFLTRTRIRIRQGRTTVSTLMPVDFADLSSEYIGILYEGLLDYELRTAPAGEPIAFLAVGNEPALPLARLEGMTDAQVKSLFEKLKDTSESDADEDADPAEVPDGAAAADPAAEDAEIEDNEEDLPEDEVGTDATSGAAPGVQGTTPDGHAPAAGSAAGGAALTMPGAGAGSAPAGLLRAEPLMAVLPPADVCRARALAWTRQACQTLGLVRRPRGTMTPEKQMQFERAIDTAAKRMLKRVVLPGEWYLVRWGGTRKGAGTFYTRPQLAVPLVQRTLRPLAYDPPAKADGSPDTDAPPQEWSPKAPEAILALKVCDPACGSGSFPVAALRFLTDALYSSLWRHHRVQGDQCRQPWDVILGLTAPGTGAGIDTKSFIPSAMADDPLFQEKTLPVLRRYIVERCIYGVELDPLAVELCRLALWIETMDRDLPFSFIDHKIKCGNSLVGAWFDQFQHYPAMAWKNREGGDKTHSNGVHFQKEARTKALKAFVADRLAPDLRQFLEHHIQGTLFSAQYFAEPVKVHDQALATLQRLHELPVQETAERVRIYREELLGSGAYRSLKSAMDLWCACWFWPADALDQAPLPSTFAAPPPETQALAASIATSKHFFHWELEFPDVFVLRDASGGSGAPPPTPLAGAEPAPTRFALSAPAGAGSFGDSLCVPGIVNTVPPAAEPAASALPSGGAPEPRRCAGFDAILGNPPWDIAKPNSKEFFANLDPLYRSYGKQEALRFQTGYFANAAAECSWLDYNADFKAQSNFMGYAPSAYGDPADSDDSKDRFGIARGGQNDAFHARWRATRAKSRGFADPAHPFRHQGSADLNLYKAMLEQAHALLRTGGRLGFIIPSGLYSDHGTGGLRQLFLDHCRWEWLFGFENRDKIFDIDSRFKFNPVIIEKGGRTEAIRTAFMRRKLDDWERAEAFVTPYTRAQVERFSPKSRAILEIQSPRDLEILEKIYANSVLLGDDGPNGWGIQYAREFDMTNDSKLFPPRPKWEEQGYRPDEYSRWLKGNWRPIAELWTELGINPSKIVPLDPACETDIAARGDAVQRTSFRLRCAQPPYDTLPIPRADIPPGIILSREAAAWIREDRIDDMALPLYEGRMIGQFDFSQKGWVSGKGRTAVWRDIDWANKTIDPQYLMAVSELAISEKGNRGPKTAYMRISSSTNARTTISTYLRGAPAGDSVFFFIPADGQIQTACVVAGVFSAFAFDVVIRQRLGGLNMSEFVMVEAALPIAMPGMLRHATSLLLGLSLSDRVFAKEWLLLRDRHAHDGLWRSRWAIAPARRLERLVSFNVVVACWYGLTPAEVMRIFSDCDWPKGISTTQFNVKGFWRVDKDKDPELRHTLLTLVAFHDLEAKIAACGGDREKGVEAFLAQNDGEGWMLPETLRLADYSLGHDERAQEPQPVASRLGPRFYDWQLAQTPEESWRECHLHARNLLGEPGYNKLLAEIASGQSVAVSGDVSGPDTGVVAYPEVSAEPELLVAEKPAELDLFGYPVTPMAGKGRKSL